MTKKQDTNAESPNSSDLPENQATSPRLHRIRVLVPVLHVAGGVARRGAILRVGETTAQALVADKQAIILY